MTLHKVCKDCKWNDYPICLGTKMGDGAYMNIENLKEGFECGRKYSDVIMDFSIKIKSEQELKIEELDARIAELEAKTATQQK